MTNSVSRIPRLALIGVTGYATIYLNFVREVLRTGTIRLSAVVIINPDQVPEIVSELCAGGTIIYASAESLFAQESGNIDLCMIPTGIQWHARLTIAALKAGMNVLVEKPLTGSVADGEAIRQAEADTGRWVAVGFQDIYSPEAHWLKTQVLAGVIGRLKEVRMIGLWPRPRAYFNRTHWAGCREADGAMVLDSPLNNAFAHFVNLSLYFAGPTLEESSTATVDTAELFRAHRIEMFDTAVVRGESPEGVRFWFGVSHAVETTRHPEIYLYGDAGRAEWWHEQRCIVIDNAGQRQILQLPLTGQFRRSMFDAVLAKLHTPSTSVCTTSVALQHTRFIEAVQHAAPVCEISSSIIKLIPDADTRTDLPCVQGLAEAMDCALVTGSTLASVASFAEPDLILR